LPFGSSFKVTLQNNLNEKKIIAPSKVFKDMLHKQSIHQKISSPPKKYIIKKKSRVGNASKKSLKRLAHKSILPSNSGKTKTMETIGLRLS